MKPALFARCFSIPPPVLFATPRYDAKSGTLPEVQGFTCITTDLDASRFACNEALYENSMGGGKWRPCARHLHYFDIRDGMTGSSDAAGSADFGFNI